MMRKTAFVLLSAIIILFCAPQAHAAGGRAEYLDGASEWAIEEIQKARITDIADYSMLCDYGKDITRLEFCRLAVKVTQKRMEQAITNSFSDTGNIWVVDKAYSLGIVNGVSETEFAPNEAITREELAVMLSRIPEIAAFELQPADLSGFEDCEQISPWAYGAVGAMVGADIICGVSETRLDPKAAVSREEAIVTAYRAYKLAFNNNILLADEAEPDLLAELGIIEQEALDSSEHITVLEALRAINRARCGDISEYTENLSSWYIGDTLAPMDYLEDDVKAELLSLCDDGRNLILKVTEIPKLKLDADITQYEALLYITRAVGDTYCCVDGPENLEVIDKDDVYKAAYNKGLISDTDTSDADKAIECREFCDILYKMLFAEYYSGGYGGAFTVRMISRHMNNAEKVAPIEEPEPETELVRLPVTPVLKDDMSVEWTLPDEYGFLLEKDVYVEQKALYKDGTAALESGMYKPIESLEVKDMIEILVDECDRADKTAFAIRVEYNLKGEPKHYFVDVDISNIKVITEGDELTPGIYTRSKSRWPAYVVSLADGETFEKDCYYLVKSYEHTYRKAEYNRVYRWVFKADTTASSLNFNGNAGVLNLDEIHIQKITISGNANTGFTLALTPESSKTFEVKELSF